MAENAVHDTAMSFDKVSTALANHPEIKLAIVFGWWPVAARGRTATSTSASRPNVR